MPRSCIPCNHADAGAIAKELAQGVPFSDVAFRFACSKSSVARHARNCLNLTRSGKPRAGKTKAPQAPRSVLAEGLRPKRARFASTIDQERCGTCGTSLSGTDPESLLRRAERLLRSAERIAENAAVSDDARLCLLAVDKARQVLESLMRAQGMIAEANSKIDARHINVFADAGISPAALEELLQLLEGKPLAIDGGKTAAPATTIGAR